MDGIDETPPETLIGFVAPWEIDANEHWNTQFYLRAFQNATDQSLAGAPPQATGRVTGEVRSVDHVRFFRELRSLETLSIRSAALPDPADGYRTAHLMRHGATGVLSACAYGTVALPGLPPLAPELRARTGPRGLPPGAHARVEIEDLLEAGRATVTHLGVLRPSGLDREGELLAHAAHNLLAEGTGHLWEFMGVSQSDFYDRGIGRAIVELKVTRYRGANAGQAVRLVSWMEELGDRGFQLRHRLECLSSGRPLADVSSLTLILDMTSRRATCVPEEIRLKLSERMRGRL